MATFYFTCGLPASGKSTFANSLNPSEIMVFSSDAVREEHPNWDNVAVFSFIYKSIKAELSAGHDCLLDATNVSRKDRVKVMQQIRKYADKVVCHLFIVPIAECIWRNKQRENNHGVDDTAIWKMVKRFKPPWYGEKIDEIIVHSSSKTSDEGYCLRYSRKELMEMQQNNPHHTLTVGEHEEAARKYICDHHMFTEHLPFLEYAARYHDDGKRFTKSFMNSRGERTNVAHYYSHENVSAYLFLVRAYCCNNLDYNFTDWGKLYIANLIAMHMRPMVWETAEKTKERDMEILGEEMIRDLIYLHEADVSAK